MENRTHTDRKRPIRTVDIDPKAKEELIANLQDFFDRNTEGFCHQSGTLYWRGYMFHSPPGMCKTSLFKAIASE